MQRKFENLPFDLPNRPQVRRIRQVGATDRADRPDERVQSMQGFEDRFTDIVDYIVRITDEIWQDRAIGYIRDTYDAACAVHSSYGVTRTADEVVRATLSAVASAPDGHTTHLNVAWSGDDDESFYTAHLGFDRVTNLMPMIYGPATGRRYVMRFAADCVSRENRIHTEWLVRDTGACLRQLGFDLDDAARLVAAQPVAEPYTADDGPYAADGAVADGPVAAWVAELFETIWNRRRLDHLGGYYAPDVIAHSGGGRTVQGRAGLCTLILSILASLPDGVMTVQHVCWSEETDGVIVAVRWVLKGTTARGGVLGRQVREGRPVFMMGSSHMRLNGPRIVEEWTVFDEVAALAMAYRE